MAAILGFAVISLFFLFSYLHSSSIISTIPAGTSGIVIVTVLDRAALSEKYIHRIKKNREDYAKRHGYTNFFADVSDYESTLDNAPRSWAMVPALRHAMTLHPHSAYFYHLGPHALIMDPSKSLESHLLGKNRLESLMLKNVPVVPPNSVVKTLPHLTSKDIELVFTVDDADLSTGSFVIRQGEFADFFLDVWSDPLYRNYNFVKAETHALDHIVQWHPTILARLALVPQRIINAYSKDSPDVTADGIYRDGDFVIRFHACESDPSRSCDKEMELYYDLWEKKVDGD